VTVAPLAAPGHKIRSEVILSAAAMTRDDELFIAPISQSENSNELAAVCDAGKVTSLLPLPLVGARDQNALPEWLNGLPPNGQSSKRRTELMMIRESCNLRGAPSE
jgi:hypothetical protein